MAVNPYILKTAVTIFKTLERNEVELVQKKGSYGGGGGLYLVCKETGEEESLPELFNQLAEIEGGREFVPANESKSRSSAGE
ncbi:hypothetical protein [Neobacillus sp. NPDC093127]|uniref:hypothetical protein n=1 Tax=Neobacillus sp. NPDC093127 TaxID=3364296 RepID=UPI0038240973